MATGEQSAKDKRSVYVRRRLWVLAGLLVVIGIVALVIWKPGSTSGFPTESKVTTSATAKPSATPTPESTEDATAEVKECSEKSVTVEALTDKGSYGANELPQLSLQITNTGKNPCSINVGTSQQVFTITSGTDVYWTSTDCQVEPADAVVQLEPGQVVASSTPIAWDRTRSSTTTCDGERPAVPSGGVSYHLSTSVAGIESAKTKQFLLDG
ncbi:hypothetical protein L1277_001689 [Okibacterium sp. HSC-33S16]|uniref:hypothetical protein n=1 Tax=Okibacterium sp. HSC-33S16 TaxID=2910965 RepID=UPI0020A1EDB8|nr:hypothetical protein [Okibacterium sp. HSC-33S16]MCP2031598.1 hypothetical protein [Okibacterium sp. HSC-33S16]